jgi:T5SS/PEP-CTERM-associated repeat protein
LRACTLFRILIFSVAFVRTALLALAQSFVFTIEDPGLQQSSLSKVPVDLFDEFGSSGKNPKPVFLSPGPPGVPFAGNAALGNHYDHLLVEPADNFGGAGGTGSYMLVSSNFMKASSPTTLTFGTPQQPNPQRYLGFWWSFGDPNNVVSFYSHGKLIETFTASEVVNLINTLPDAKLYNGNPNLGNQGKANGGLFAFINFYADPNVTFDQVVFSNAGSDRFQLDNLTTATNYPENTVLGEDSDGVIDAEGSGSKVMVDDKVTVGESEDGEFDIKGGATVNDKETTIGQNPGSQGIVDLDGTGSKLTDTGVIVVGEGGSGELVVTDGASVSDTNATVGAEKGSTGTVIVDGADSQWNNSGSLDIGPVGTGVVDVADGAP